MPELVLDELFEDDELFSDDDELSLDEDVPRLPPVDVVVAVLGLALIEPVAFVDVPVPVVALGLVDIELSDEPDVPDVPDVPDIEPLDEPDVEPLYEPEFVDEVPVPVVLELLPVEPELAEPVPPSEVPVAEVPLEPVPLLPPLPVPAPAPAPPPAWARATLPARPMMHRAAVAKVDLAFMCVS